MLVQPQSRVFYSRARGMVQVPWGFAIAVVILGIGLLSFAIPRAMRAPVDDTAELNTDIEHRQAELAKNENDIALLREQLKPLQTDIGIREAELRRAEVRLATRLGQVSALEEQNRAQKGESEQRLKLVKQSAEHDLGRVASLEKKDADLRTQQAKFEQVVKSMKDVIVTVASKRGQLASGFLLDGLGEPTVVTSSRAVQGAGDLVVKVRFKRQNGEDVVAAGPARLRHNDISGLAFLTFNPQEPITLSALSADKIKDANVGDLAFAVGTQLLGNAVMMEFNVMDGTVSATDRKFGDRTFLQVSVPCNPGARGSPVFAASGELIGILFDAVPGLDRAALAVPAGDLSAALARAKKGR